MRPASSLHPRGFALQTPRQRRSLAASPLAPLRWLARNARSRVANVFLILVLLLAGCGATTSRTNDDLTTSTQVKIALLSDARLGALRLDVRTFQGVVTLAGTVRSPADEAHAIVLAKRIQGVREVRSQLKVEGRTPRPAQ